MSGRLINGIKHMYINDENDFKKKSLEDNVYFTLRDIFRNCDSIDTCFEANSFNARLTGDVCFEDRTDKFKYTNVLYEKDYVESLHMWLKYFNEYYFEFLELEEGEEIEYVTYVKFDDWWVHFEELRQLIEQQYEKLKNWEKDVERNI